MFQVEGRPISRLTSASFCVVLYRKNMLYFFLHCFFWLQFLEQPLEKSATLLLCPLIISSSCNISTVETEMRAGKLPLCCFSSRWIIADGTLLGDARHLHTHLVLAQQSSPDGKWKGKGKGEGAPGGRKSHSPKQFDILCPLKMQILLIVPLLLLDWIAVTHLLTRKGRRVSPFHQFQHLCSLWSSWWLTTLFIASAILYWSAHRNISVLLWPWFGGWQPQFI